LFPPDCICRMKKIQMPRIRSIGDQVSSMVRNDPSFGGSAFTFTWCSCRVEVSASFFMM